MANRVAIIAQKRATLCKQLETLSNLIAQGEYNQAESRARYDRIKTLFHAYEEMHDELSLLELDQEGILEMDGISKKFYTIAGKITSERDADVSNANATVPGRPMGNSTFIEKQRQLKLPVAELPKFDGNLDQWLSFRNTFKAIVESRSDVDDIVKFMYLKNCLIGEAAHKITAYDMNKENYANAWALLTDAYERKRILISKHLDCLFDIPKLIDTSSNGLSKMIDTTRQHVNMLESLEYCPRDYVIVRILEKALPNDIRLKWEESLSLDAIPTLKEFYTFIGGVIFRLHTMERDTAKSQISRSGKRQGDRDLHGVKLRKTEAGSRAFITSTSASCVQCQGDHIIYRCPVFEKLSTQQRWDSIKSKKLCRNCLRQHSDECKSSRCKHCNRFHHTLLHTTRSEKPTSTNTFSYKSEANPKAPTRSD